MGGDPIWRAMTERIRRGLPGVRVYVDGEPMVDPDVWEPDRIGPTGPILPVDVARRLVREWAAINDVSFAFDFDLLAFELAVREDERSRAAR